MVNDAREKGAEITTGGERIGNVGNFYKPTVIAGAPLDSKIMNEEPFGPVAVINRFKDFDEVVEEANRLPYGLAAYAYTRSAARAKRPGPKASAAIASMREMIVYIARALASNPDAVSVTEEDGGDRIYLHLSVDDQDKGKVIGRDGRVAQSMRSLLRVAAVKAGTRVSLEID